jgi:hypothetical protein
MGLTKLRLYTAHNPGFSDVSYCKKETPKNQQFQCTILRNLVAMVQMALEKGEKLNTESRICLQFYHTIFIPTACYSGYEGISLLPLSVFLMWEGTTFTLTNSSKCATINSLTQWERSLHGRRPKVWSRNVGTYIIKECRQILKHTNIHSYRLKNLQFRISVLCG